MANPPERITVKRRRDDEPVDTLYLQAKKIRPSTCWTRINVSHLESLFPLQSNLQPQGLQRPKSTVNQSQRSKEAHLAGKALPLRPSGSNDAPRAPTDGREGSEGSCPSEGRRSSPRRRSEGLSRTEAGRIQRRGPRRFHLATGAETGWCHADLEASAPLNKVKRSRSNLAVLVENCEKSYDLNRAKRMADMYVQDFHSPNAQADVSVRPGPSNRKRPVVSKAEALRKSVSYDHQKQEKRDGTKGSNGVVKTLPSQGDYSEELAAELQHFALQESEATAVVQPPLRKTKLRFQPKPAKPRKAREDAQQARHMMTPDVTDPQGKVDEDRDDGGDEDYVYDVFVKSLPAVDEASESEISFEDLDGSARDNIGVLIIEDDQEASWEALGVADQSDPEWSSEEDENAEDHYGNDYPEDEPSSEDDDDGQAYKFRGRQFDYAEFDTEFQTDWR